ncbi:MAG: DUF5362 domain-containing protein [Bacteroidota bacterium]|nr:DUF5362 domain-containing protein [Bacteroidota bacterium]
METSETFEQPAAEPALILNLEAQSYLREAGKWASFLGIVGFIFCGFIVIAALFIGSILSMATKFSPDPTAAGMMAGMSGFLTVFYLLIGIVYFFFSLYLYQFGSQVKKGIMFSDNNHVTGALGKLKSFFKLWGILTIIILCLYALIIIGAIIFGAAAASMMNK